MEGGAGVPNGRFWNFFLSDKRLRAGLTTLFGMYEDTIFGAVAAIL